MIKLKCVFFFHVLGKSRSIDEKQVNVPRHRLDKIKILDEPIRSSTLYSEVRLLRARRSEQQPP
ncbi:predicted protein [Plenodomus lingam JN3]|uniref:Predicted protein n=1 Tax=Leptosphaeria maculans (strain JN3 / isolate v23.1.3 / race Av1-4-5-6-7-8) TaxID=985895 RepID=E5AFA1_LEPMJ|nr:predicted protein [Plenodomus lingam JN3]CBY01890.1 predicted protein [Plenodomus lingam JN3]